MQFKTLETTGLAARSVFQGETLSEILLADTALSGTVTIVDFRTAGLDATAQGARSLTNMVFVLSSSTITTTDIIQYALVGVTPVTTTTSACTTVTTAPTPDIYTVDVADTTKFSAGSRISVYKANAASASDEYMRGIVTNIVPGTGTAGSLQFYAIDATGVASTATGQGVGGWFAYGKTAANCNQFLPSSMGGRIYLRPTGDTPRLVLYSATSSHASVFQVN